MIDILVTVNVTGYQILEIPLYMLHGDTRKGELPSDIKAIVKYEENLHTLAVVLIQ